MQTKNVKNVCRGANILFDGGVQSFLNVKTCQPCGCYVVAMSTYMI